MSKMDEMILAIPRTALFGTNDEGAFQGVHRTIDLLGEHAPVVKRRGDLEEDPTYKQLITYMIVREQAEGKYLMYRRIGNGDARLHLRGSIGVGGHANEIEGVESLHETMMINALREVHEELFAPEELEGEVFGYLNDDSDEVGRVHVGVIYLTTVPSAADVALKETDTLELHWATKDELHEQAETLENWSKLLLPYLV